MSETINRSWMIGDIVEKYPHVTEVLMGYGLHCFGCHANGMESIEDGAYGHGMSDEDIDEMIEQINQAIAKGPSEQAGIPGQLLTMTKAAVDKVRDLAKKDNKESWTLKVFVIPGGCSGFKYGMDFVEKAGDNDTWIEQHGMKVYVDNDSVQFIKGAIIDYVDTLHDSGFKISNPNASRTCGCGSSFS